MKTTAEPTDSTLMHRICLGNEDAFAELYLRRQHDVYRFAFALSKSAAIAQDVTQDVFLNVLQNAGRFDASRGSVRAWLIGCARYLVLDRMRADRRWSGEPTEEACEPCGGERELTDSQRAEMLHDAILALPMEYRVAVVLCELEELSYAECAELLGCPIGTVRSRLHRGKALLAARLGKTPQSRAAAAPVGDTGARKPDGAEPPLLAAGEVCP